ncbi:MAG: acyl-CoA dehydrogenase [Deltaproteobacteria bacterium]|nr:acyl-CoA dehydrogenase [Deltaproteobacteria bacterium]
MANPLLSDRDVDFLLYEVLDAQRLAQLPHFADHSRETFDSYLGNCRRFAREQLWPSYRALDEKPPQLLDGKVTVHPLLRTLLPQLRELGVISASQPVELGGAQLPLTIATAATLYLMAGNLSVYGYAGLTSGAAHLLSTFGDAALRARYLAPMLEGSWTGTMALTEPQAGSSLADVRSRATPHGDHFRISGQKIFISGGDHDLAENIIHMVLARIDGAPPGIKGVSLFLVPKFRAGANGLVANDVSVSGLIHKIGWRGLPSVALSLGEQGDCEGWLVGEPNRGISHMFQMMNEARIMVGANAVATASVAFHQSLAYARERPQGRGLTSKDAAKPQVPIIEHADVRRMLLRQKAIVEGGLALILSTAHFADLAEHAGDGETRARAQLLLDLLTPVAKSFPAEKGFESNALAVQIHGGYGYSSEYLPEAWLRDQKLNSIHEGTTGIQGMDLLGRKVVAQGGAALVALQEEVARTCERAEKACVDAAWISAIREAMERIGALTMELAQRGLGGDVDGMMRHSADYLELFSVFIIGWQWLELAAVAREGMRRSASEYYEGKLAAAQYWIRTELPRLEPLIALCRENEDSYARMKPEWF